MAATGCLAVRMISAQPMSLMRSKVRWQLPSAVAATATVSTKGYGLARLRFELLFGAGPGPVFDYFKITADRGMGIVEPHLAANAWLACNRPTIADISVYPVMSYLADAGYDVADFPGVAAWLDRFRALPGFALQLELMPIVNWPPA